MALIFYLRGGHIFYISVLATTNTAVFIQVQYSIRVLTDGVYVSGSSIVDTRRGYDEVFNTKLHYNMPGLHIECLHCWVCGESCRCRMCLYTVYMYRPMALVMCSTCIMLRTPRVLGHGCVPLRDPQALVEINIYL